jgi:prevent-host-death family protein
MKVVNLHAAKTHLSRLVDAAAGGEDVVIAKAGKPMVRLVPVAIKRRRGGFGRDRGRMRIGDDFNAPLPHDLLRAGGHDDDDLSAGVSRLRRAARPPSLHEI